MILARHDAAGKLELRYLTVCGLRQDSDGSVYFEAGPFAPGFPLRIFEDDRLAVPEASRREWLNSWYSELVGSTLYTKRNTRMPSSLFTSLRDELPEHATGDAGLLDRFKKRRRRSVLMLAGGAETGIPHDQRIVEPYDRLSFAPTILDLMGSQAKASELPGRVIEEVIAPRVPQPTHQPTCSTTRKSRRTVGGCPALLTSGLCFPCCTRQCKPSAIRISTKKHCKCSTSISGLRKLTHRNCAKSGLNPNMAAPLLLRLLRRQQRSHIANDSLLLATELLSKFGAAHAPLPFLLG